jgi:hypothetical protein
MKYRRVISRFTATDPCHRLLKTPTKLRRLPLPFPFPFPLLVLFRADVLGSVPSGSRASAGTGDAFAPLGLAVLVVGVPLLFVLGVVAAGVGAWILETRPVVAGVVRSKLPGPVLAACTQLLTRTTREPLQKLDVEGLRAEARHGGLERGVQGAALVAGEAGGEALRGGPHEDLRVDVVADGVDAGVFVACLCAHGVAIVWRPCL